ncbi:hypothetical protein [Pseudidiomarina homiensis]|uniref:hypothetical protein n=1 Tax=Pseudidiomarina homiensis TaxID=364198 RepID=UPI00215B3584|nr:hypothetical protein [Pseudidiomarina homiensis]
MVGTTSKRSYFFISISLFFLALAVLGFSASFWRGVEEGLSNLPWILHVHALSMMGWLTLVILQALLILKGKLTWHYGFAGVGLVLITSIILTGLGLSTNSLFWVSGLNG